MSADLDAALARFRTLVIAAAQAPHFVHHRWYVDYHLLLVEQIALELCAAYPQADVPLVRALVWLHDYGKIVDRDNERAATFREGRRALAECGCPDDFIDRALHAYTRHEEHETLREAPIEVRIVSSADAASHLVGPFYALWWYEHPERLVATLLDDNRRKALYDWEKKLVLPEARAAFATRHRRLLEQCGEFPAAFLNGDAGDPAMAQAGTR